MGVMQPFRPILSTERDRNFGAGNLTRVHQRQLKGRVSRRLPAVAAKASSSNADVDADADAPATSSSALAVGSLRLRLLSYSGCH